jgi:hypothetical protein
MLEADIWAEERFERERVGCSLLEMLTDRQTCCLESGLLLSVSLSRTQQLQSHLQFASGQAPAPIGTAAQVPGTPPLSSPPLANGSECNVDLEFDFPQYIVTWFVRLKTHLYKQHRAYRK